MSKKGNRIRKPGNKNSFKGHRSPEKKAGTKVPGYARPKNADVIVSVSSNAPRGPLEVRNQCVGILRQAGMDGIVEPDAGYSLAQYGQIRVRAGQLNGAPFGMKVVCEISNRCVSGMYEEESSKFWVIPNSDIAMLGVIRQFGLSPEFPEPVLAAAMKYPIDLSDVEIQAEIDLEEKIFVC